MREGRANLLPLVLAGVVWLGAVCAGLARLETYANTPGTPALSTASIPSTWPSASRLPRQPGLPVLVMMVHPRCPCSRASVGELSELMSRCRGLASAVVVFQQPRGFDKDWVETDLWRSAAAIPAATLEADADGRECSLFGARTSGQTLLYDASGALVFAGGITSARGHAGRNAGTDAIEALLRDGRSTLTRTNVFGCALAEHGDGRETG